MGEPAHGSGEFTDWRRRAFQALVRDKGFSVYAVETCWADALVLDDYIVHGKGDARSALRALYSWKDVTSQTLALVEWMREYKRRPAARDQSATSPALTR
jgi:erythromycin esterase